MQHGSRTPGGLTVVTGTSGTGKTTTCRTILESLDRRTFTSLVLNPYVSEEDLLRLILQDFGVISRDEIRRGLLDGVRAIELLRTLEEFLEVAHVARRAGAPHRRRGAETARSCARAGEAAVEACS